MSAGCGSEMVRSKLSQAPGGQTSSAPTPITVPEATGAYWTDTVPEEGLICPLGGVAARASPARKRKAATSSPGAVESPSEARRDMLRPPRLCWREGANCAADRGAATSLVGDESRPGGFPGTELQRPR